MLRHGFAAFDAARWLANMNAAGYRVVKRIISGEVLKQRRDFSSEDATRRALPAQAGFRWQCRLVGCLFVLHHNAAGNRVAFLVFAEGDGLLREGNLDA